MDGLSVTCVVVFSFRRHVLSLHLNGSNILMKKLQLLFAFLAHTQVSVVPCNRCKRIIMQMTTTDDTTCVVHVSFLQRAAYAPRNFLEASRPPWFNVGSQQDCSEYLRFLLDRYSRSPSRPDESIVIGLCQVRDLYIVQEKYKIAFP